MSDERELLKKRFTELSHKSYSQGIFLFTDFLGLMEQAAFSEVKGEIRGEKYTFFGGADGCERVMVRFGDEEELGYSMPFPITVLLIEPRSEKFAERLTHRDYLGAILNLGIERRLIGDIVIRDTRAYVFVKEEIADFIVSELSRARHTELRLSVVDSLPEGALYKTEGITVQANGERLDALIAKAFSLSRDMAQSYFSKGLVFVSGRCTENTSYIPKEGEVVSVRGLGRFIYRGVVGHSRKGKLNIALDLYK
jgi:RNA-binding protein YlmH